MPFGLTNAPSTFQHFMNKQLGGWNIVHMCTWMISLCIVLTWQPIWGICMKCCIACVTANWLSSARSVSSCVTSWCIWGMSCKLGVCHLTQLRCKPSQSWLHLLMSASCAASWAAATSTNALSSTMRRLLLRSLTCWVPRCNGSGVPLSKLHSTP